MDGKLQIRINQIIDELPCGSREQARKSLNELIEEVKIAFPSYQSLDKDIWGAMVIVEDIKTWFKQNFGIKDESL